MSATKFAAFVFAAIILAELLLVASLNAQGIPRIPPGVPAYKVNLADEWVASETGLMPIRVTIENFPLAAAVRDEEFTVVIKQKNVAGSPRTISRSLTLPTGATSTYVDIMLDRTSTASRIDQLIVERGAGDGHFDSGRDLLNTSLQAGKFNFYAGGIAATLVVSSKFNGRDTSDWYCFDNNVVQTTATFATGNSQPASIDMLMGIVSGDPDYVKNNTGTPATTVQELLTAVHYCRPIDIPDTWMGLSAVQYLIISFDDFKALCVADSARRTAVKRWVALGGNLIVYDAGQKFTSTDTIHRLLLGQGDATQSSGDPASTSRQWRFPSRQLREFDRMIVSDFYTDYVSPSGVTGRSHLSYADEFLDEIEDRIDDEIDRDSDGRVMPEALLLRLSTKPSNESKFLLSDYANGKVIGIEDDMSSWTAQDWLALLNTLKLNCESLRSRLGVGTNNNAVSGFSIPGVGEPPIVSFQVLISLFVIVAGPVMYIVLTRVRRMQLLFLLVPLLSLFACGGLLLYAMFGDGFETWGRVQSVTHLDQRHHVAVTQARAAYYSARQPRPYTYDSQTMATSPGSRNSAERLVRQGDDSVVLSGGDIRPRTPHQVLTTRSYDADQSLIWLLQKSKESDATKPRGCMASNRLGAKVLYAVARTEAGLFAIENLESEQKTQAITIDETTANQKLRNRVKPLIPDFLPSRSSRFSYFARTTVTRGDEGRYVSQIESSEAIKLLEVPNSFIAILEDYPAVEPQINSANYKNQLHVIVGKW